MQISLNVFARWDSQLVPFDFFNYHFFWKLATFIWHLVSSCLSEEDR